MVPFPSRPEDVLALVGRSHCRMSERKDIASSSRMPAFPEDIGFLPLCNVRVLRNAL